MRFHSGQLRRQDTDATPCLPSSAAALTGETSCAIAPRHGPQSAKFLQDMILALHDFWSAQGCLILQPYDMRMGAGTFHTATTLRALGPEPWNAAFVQPCRRPTDGRYGENPNRLQHYYQYQVILKPSPPDIQDLYLESLEVIGIDPLKHDIRFVEDDWESPTLGAWGLGWEVWCDGMEVTQFTYFQQMGGFDCKPVAGELTYGLERLAMYMQGVDNVYDLDFNDRGVKTYGDVFLEAEKQFSKWNFEHADTDALFDLFNKAEAECRNALANAMFRSPPTNRRWRLPHLQPVLQARGVINVLDAPADLGRSGDLLYRSCPRAGQGSARRPGNIRSGRNDPRRLPSLAPARARDCPAGAAAALRPALCLAQSLCLSFSSNCAARKSPRACRRARPRIWKSCSGANWTRPASTVARRHHRRSTPRRLALVARGLPLAQPDVSEEEAQGSAGRRAGEGGQGLLQKRPVDKRDRAEVRETSKGRVYYSRSSKVRGARDRRRSAGRSHARDHADSLAEVDALGRADHTESALGAPAVGIVCAPARWRIVVPIRD